MRDQDMVNDILTGTKASINTYTHAIQECSDQTLRSTLQQLRDEAEQLQFQVYQMAEQKGWYKPSPQADQKDVQEVKTGLTSSSQSSSKQNTNYTMN